MINTIIFDLGMVLVNFRWHDFIEEFDFTKEVKEAVSKAMVQSKEWNEFDRSLLSDEEILSSFIRNAPEYEKEIAEVFQNIGNTVATYDYTKPWIQELKKKGYKIYILSNYPRRTYDLSKKQLDFLEVCDGALFSFEVKKIKPEEEIFHLLLDKYNIKSEEAVFLDDNINNIEAAQKLGIHSIHFTTRDNAVQELNKIFRQF
ncbi:putative hydrolase of the HAD superfamily [Lachnotalea glycerini]|uniref:HAD family phosphatase n=1 Tax=Lachnotalea glycerini TaxID=1763509 RepID=A0A255IJY1_9FIRM|nr:HAD family phosphatase [Lachnotalea glycerini]PXV89476.1 putative hydrolase of the HAD superfamily [Lachnotalea glycerini]RDY32338.1 HAD family phosphatase [Lachnotalea glycerini]